MNLFKVKRYTRYYGHHLGNCSHKSTYAAITVIYVDILFFRYYLHCYQIKERTHVEPIRRAWGQAAMQKAFKVSFTKIPLKFAGYVLSGKLCIGWDNAIIYIKGLKQPYQVIE